MRDDKHVMSPRDDRTVYVNYDTGANSKQQAFFCDTRLPVRTVYKLPSAKDHRGWVLRFIDQGGNASDNPFALLCSTGDRIAGVGDSYSFSSPHGVLTVVSDGQAAWYVC